ncbi:signal peptidase I [Enterococcus sp. 669A]|uniref:Signal peptidase I n=1 Tax=Candidatus Enterococcus moelleringii TaxID=2815325 RepID=A0ABS3L7K0_9ENTE|nr:signal peptidase I [Enterococcus sp. 669A]
MIFYFVFSGVFRAYHWAYPKYFVSGESMFPTYKEEEVIQIISHGKPKRFDVVVLRPPENPKGRYLKRVIGLPGERINYRGGKLFVNEQVVNDPFGKETEDFNWGEFSIDPIPEGYYFILGDNRSVSQDSRHFGLITRRQILGIVQEGIIK